MRRDNKWWKKIISAHLLGYGRCVRMQSNKSVDCQIALIAKIWRTDRPVHWSSLSSAFFWMTCQDKYLYATSGKKKNITCKNLGGHRIGQKLFAIDWVSESWHSESVNHIENVFSSVACHFVTALLKKKIDILRASHDSRHDARHIRAAVVAKLHEKLVKTKGDPV